MANPTPSQTLVTVNPRPKFLFFGMTWCPHCIYFAKGQKDQSGKEIMAPQWPIMLADKELNSKVDLQHIEWNHKDKDGAGRPMKVIPRPPGYDFINAGPMFELEAGKDASGNSVGVIFAGGPRSAADLKKWILNQLATNPLFKSRGPIVTQQQQPRTPAAVATNKHAGHNHATPAAATTAPSQPRPNNMVGNKSAPSPVQSTPPKQVSGADKLRAAMANQQQQASSVKTPVSPPVAAGIPPATTGSKKVNLQTPTSGGKTNFTYRQAGTTTRIVANLN